MTRILKSLMAAAVVMLLATSSARADFQINVYVGGTLVFNAIDQVAEDDNTAPGNYPAGGAGNIAVTNALSGGALFDLNTALAGAGATIQFTNLSAISNSLTGAGGFATLEVQGTAVGSYDGVITVEVSANGYNVPSGDASLTSTANQIYTDANGNGTSTTSTFQSFFNQNNDLFGRVTAGGVLSFTPPPTLGTTAQVAGALTSGSNPLALGVISPGFSLTNVTEFTLTGTPNSTLKFQGTTLVNARAIPEPGSVALLLLGGSALALRARRRSAIA